MKNSHYSHFLPVLAASFLTACATTPAPAPETPIEQAVVEQNSVAQDTTEAVQPDSTEIVEPDSVEVIEPDSTENVEPDPGPLTPPLTPVQQLIQSGDYDGARTLAFNDFAAGNASNLDEFWAAYDADPLLSQTLDETVRPHETNSLNALGGGSTVSLKYTDTEDETAKAAIKPDQDLRQTMYRSEIAYYRMCQVLGCSFDTPVTRPVRWSKSDFNALYNQGTKKNKNYSSKFTHLIWATENNSRYLYAAYKEWIPSFTAFPIEVTEAWSPWLRVGASNPPDLRSLFRAMLQGARPDSINTLGKLMEYADGLTSRMVLRQISDLTLIDYLTNNWDRYSGARDNYGANCHFQPGGIIAIDNGAAFPPWHAPRVVKRLHLVQTFSRDLVQKLRLIDPDELFDHLFPNPTKEEEHSRDRFKERRKDALKYIDGLIQKYGEDKVLIF